MDQTLEQLQFQAANECATMLPAYLAGKSIPPTEVRDWHIKATIFPEPDSENYVGFVQILTAEVDGDEAWNNMFDTVTELEMYQACMVEALGALPYTGTVTQSVDDMRVTG